MSQAFFYGKITRSVTLSLQTNGARIKRNKNVIFLTYWLMDGWIPGFFVAEMGGIVLSGLAIWWLLVILRISSVIRLTLIGLIMLSLTSRIGSGLNADILVYVLITFSLASACFLSFLDSHSRDMTSTTSIIFFSLVLVVTSGLLLLIRPFHGLGAVFGVLAVLFITYYVFLNNK